MSYFCGLSLDEVKKVTGIEDDLFNHSLGALRFAKIANGVSQLHGDVSREMWKDYENICPIISITNAQNWRTGQINNCTITWNKATMCFSMTEKNT